MIPPGGAWLLLAKIALLLVSWRTLRELGVSRIGAGMGLAVLLLGNAAFSLLPHVPSDDDYPLVMNASMASLFVIAGVVILARYLCRRFGAPATKRSGPRFQWAGLAVPAIFVIALVVSRAGDRGDRRDRRPAAAPAVSMSMVSVTHPGWWYLPEVVPGIATGLGNLPLAAGAMGASPPASSPFNEVLLSRARQPGLPPAYKAVALIYLVELRAFETIQAIWFPLIGVLALGWLAASSADGEPRGRLRVFFVTSGVIFAAGVSVVFLAGSAGESAPQLKWALSRALVPGLYLGTLSLVVVTDRVLARATTGWRYAVWAGLVAVMTFGTWFRMGIGATL